MARPVDKGAADPPSLAMEYGRARCFSAPSAGRVNRLATSRPTRWLSRVMWPVSAFSDAKDRIRWRASKRTSHATTSRVDRQCHQRGRACPQRVSGSPGRDQRRIRRRRMGCLRHDHAFGRSCPTSDTMPRGLAARRALALSCQSRALRSIRAQVQPCVRVSRFFRKVHPVLFSCDVVRRGGGPALKAVLHGSERRKGLFVREKSR